MKDFFIAAGFANRAEADELESYSTLIDAYAATRELPDDAETERAIAAYTTGYGPACAATVRGYSREFFRDSLVCTAVAASVGIDPTLPTLASNRFAHVYVATLTERERLRRLYGRTPPRPLYRDGLHIYPN